MYQYNYQNVPVSQKKSKNLLLFVRALTLLILILFSSVSYAQKIEGTVRYLKVMNFVKLYATVDYLSKQTIDKLTYMYANMAEYKSYGNLYINPAQTKYEDSDESAEKDDREYSYRKSDYMITRNYEKNTMFDILDLIGKTYIIEDTIHVAQWKILNEMKEIAGHICMNAFLDDTLRKQKVIGWFALDIQNGGGPERFYGLPGLILEVNINNGATVMTADKIELKKLTTELTLPKKNKGKKIKEVDFDNILKKEFAERRKAEQPFFMNVRY
jgi:GLPGLI family protein